MYKKLFANMSHVKRTHYDHRTFFLRTYLICRYSFMCPLINLKRDVCPFKGRTVDASLKVSHNMKTHKKVCLRSFILSLRDVFTGFYYPQLDLDNFLHFNFFHAFHVSHRKICYMLSKQKILN